MSASSRRKWTSFSHTLKVIAARERGANNRRCFSKVCTVLLLSSMASLCLLEGLSTWVVLQGTARHSPSKQHQIFCLCERKMFVSIMTNAGKMWILRESLFSNTGTAEYQMQSSLLCVVIGTPGISDGCSASLLGRPLCAVVAGSSSSE